MNKQQYRVTRRLLRDNGAYAKLWLSLEQLRVWEPLLEMQALVDPLQERADIIGYCKRAGIACNVRHTRVW